MSIGTPSEAGFFMPAEWERHACCWMAWPCRRESYYDIEAARDEHTLVARAIARPGRGEVRQLILVRRIATWAWGSVGSGDSAG